jgi:hypothetical protein
VSIDGGPAGTRGRTVASRPQTRRARRLLGVAVIVVVAGAAAYAIYRQRDAFSQALHDIGAGGLLLSLALGAVGVGLTFLSWREVLLGLDVDLPTGTAARVFFTSQLGKYLPGSVWPVLMQMEAGRSRGASRRTMLAANLVTIVLGCVVGLLLACVLLPLSDARALSRYWWLLLALPFLLALLHPRVMPWLFDRVAALLRRPAALRPLPVRDTVRASLWFAASFTALGVHVAVLAWAVGGGGGSTLLLGIGGMALAVSAGVLFIPAPAGAGVRDVILILVLSAVLTGGQALAVVVASRVLLIAADVLLAGLAAGIRRRA